METDGKSKTNKLEEKPGMKKAKSTKPKREKRCEYTNESKANSEGENKKKAYQPSDFKIIKEVGEGSYGRVYLANRVTDNRKVAIKMLDKHHLIKSHKVDHVMREKKILSEFTHPNLIELVGTFQDEDNLYFALGYEANGDLIGLLNRMKKFPIRMVRYFTAQLVGVLQFIHFNGIVHRDLKPENILLDIQ